MPQARHPKTGKPIDTAKLDQIVASARRASDDRAAGYRAQALKLYPWVCGRCGREFSNQNLRELTVHHKDMDHDNNPPDGGNWELLCLYCHDNEHQKFEEHLAALASGRAPSASAQSRSQTPSTHRPFDALGDLLKHPSASED